MALGIKRSKGASDVVVAAAVQKRIDALEDRLPRSRPQADRHLGRIHQGQLRSGDLDPVRRRDPRRHHRAAVPARYQGHHHRRDLAAAVDLPGVLGDGYSRLFAEPRQLPRDHAVDRHPGRRRHRRDREHRAPYADGQIALPRRARGRRRNRPRRHRDLADDHRDLRAGELHVGHRRAILQAVRHHGIGAGVFLAAGRALRDADAGRLFPEGSTARRSAARPPAANLHPARHLVGEAPLDHRADRLRHLRRLDLEHHAVAARLPAGAGHRALAAGDGAAARLAARLYRKGHRRDRRAPAQAARGREASSSTAAGCRRERSKCAARR